MTETIVSSETLVEKPESIAVLREGITSGSISAVQLAEEYYARIAAHNPLLNVYLSLTKEQALEQAERWIASRP